MLTYSHAVVGYLAFFKTSSRARKLAIWGSITPDILLVFGFLFLGIGNIFGGSSAHEIHMAVHRAEVPQAITNALHSIIIIAPIALIVGLIWESVFPFFAGILLHIGIDFLTHQKWPYNHLYPIDAEPVVAILSFWNPWFIAIEHGILFVLIVIFYIRRRRTHAKDSQ